MVDVNIGNCRAAASGMLTSQEVYALRRAMIDLAVLAVGAIFVCSEISTRCFPPLNRDVALEDARWVS